ILIAISIIEVNSEPPRFRSSFRVRNSRLRFAKQELPPPPEEPTPEEPAPSAAPSGPYPPSGWKPSGRAFPLPTEKEAEPDNTYGPPERTTVPPDTTYGPPDNTYGPPDNTYGPPQEMTTEQASAPYPPSQPPSGPYPPSGWKPSGRAFPLPTEKEAEPDQTYGAPDNKYGPPENTYGPPESESTSTTIPDTEDDTVIVDAPIEGQPEAFFYIRLPNGTIQKVSFSPTKTVEQFKSARLRQNSRFNEFVYIDDDDQNDDNNNVMVGTSG
ncbi:uncharacterized protein LOC129618854, partial [Condylostylus longicornis]|uniref:uncharacterized protein LOC129618854 n=1 Tax=Condylostylus longicornis TaxID=2530218 RepID=UPI00244DE890